ncbi:MAG: hypothetical protein K2Q23_11105, partial [Bryobacteraceae bacterium]|nr:hypothetical protein [Bryobacteraceae bacterium]
GGGRGMGGPPGGGMGGGGADMGGGMGGMGGGGGMGGPGGGGGGMGGAGGGMGGGGGMQMPKVKVAFETALPVAEAKARIEVKDAFVGLREQYVVISVSGMRMMGGMGGRGAAGGGEGKGPGQVDPAERAKAMQERLLQATSLKVDKEKVFQPTEAKMQQTAGGAVMLFAFPRNELKLTPEDKQVTFKTSMGPMEISVKFNLKDMVFDKQLSM